MSIGIHCDRREKTGLTRSLYAAFKDLKGSNCAQIFMFGPQSSKMTNFDSEELEDICRDKHIYVHSSYRTSWKGDISHMREQFSAAAQIGAQGVVLHLAKLSPEKHIEILKTIPNKMDTSPEHYCKYILEMRALKPDEWTYQTPKEINLLCKALKDAEIGPNRAIICLDTAHISAAKIQLRTREDAQTYINELEYPEYIGLLHLNGNTYNPAERAGDHHCVPHTEEDWVFHNRDEVVDFSNSGALELARWFISRKCDIILEQDISKELYAFYKQLTDAL